MFDIGNGHHILVDSLREAANHLEQGNVGKALRGAKVVVECLTGTEKGIAKRVRSKMEEVVRTVLALGDPRPLGDYVTGAEAVAKGLIAGREEWRFLLWEFRDRGEIVSTGRWFPSSEWGTDTIHAPGPRAASRKAVPGRKPAPNRFGHALA